MKTTNMSYMRLGDVGHFERRMTRFQTGIEGTFARYVKRDAFEEKAGMLDDRIAQPEKRHDAEAKALTDGATVLRMSLWY